MSNPEKTTYYTLLGVEKNATIKQIKTGFRKMSLQHHPDRGGNIEVFKNINEAHEVLSNEQSRKLYDTHGEKWKELSKNTQRTFRREDLVIIEMQLDPVSILKDNQFTEKSRRITLCRPCKGSGYPGAKIVKCTTCNGAGIVNQLINGMMMVQNHCPRCQGKKEMVESAAVPPCRSCNAQGKILEEFKHTFTVFAGTPENYQYIFEDVGNETEIDIRSPILVIVHHKKIQNGITIAANGDIHQTIKIRLDHALHLTPIRIKSFLTDSKANMNLELYALDHEATNSDKIWTTKPIANNESIKISGYGVKKSHDFEVQSSTVPEIDSVTGDWVLTFEIVLPSAHGSHQAIIKQEKGVSIALENAYHDNKELDMSVQVPDGSGYKRIEWASVRNSATNTPQASHNAQQNGQNFHNGQPECRQM